MKVHYYYLVIKSHTYGHAEYYACKRKDTIKVHKYYLVTLYFPLRVEQILNNYLTAF